MYEVTTRPEAAYPAVKSAIEEEALELARQQPTLHLADACLCVLTANPEYWQVYRAAIGAGLPSEFQRALRSRAVPTPKDRAWNQIETLARTLVAASAEPMTLRSAVERVVEANPELYRRYAGRTPPGNRAKSPANRRKHG
jgi:hypothetical protein